MTPVSQPSGLGELSASIFTEPDLKHEVIQRVQVSSLMGANGNKEPQDKTPRKQTPASATRPKKYALEMWVEIETNAGVHSAPEEDLYSVDFAIDTINHAYPGCTGMYLGVVGHMLAFYGKKTNPRADWLEIKKGVPLARMVAANEVLKVTNLFSTEQTKEQSTLTEAERQDLLLEKLDLSGLEAWPEEQAGKARSLLKEYHDIFSLEKRDMGHANELSIKLSSRIQTLCHSRSVFAGSRLLSWMR